jgi:UDP-N-acetylglucosamine 2-epimerase
MSKKVKIMVVLGIRPDFIRMSSLLKKMAVHPNVELCLVATGQHYDRELKDVFFDEMKIPKPHVTLDTRAETHPQQHAKLISQLEKPMDDFKPDVCLFLGDANAVYGCITALKKKVPIAHIEAGMRSFNWAMPEERNRVIIDRVSDVLYTYHDNYKVNLVREGINPSKIVTVGNIIVDVIVDYASEIKASQILDRLGVKPNDYVLFTMHRDEHVTNPDLARHIVYSVGEWAKKKGVPVVWPQMPRAAMIEYDQSRLKNFIITKPLGMFDFVNLERAAKVEFTDSGSNQEVAALLGTPCVVTRSCTERPETFESNVSTMELDKIGEAADWVENRVKDENYQPVITRVSSKILDDLIVRCSFESLSPYASAIDPHILSHFVAPRF